MFINLNKYMIKRKTCNDRDTWSGGTKDLINICPESNPLPCIIYNVYYYNVSYCNWFSSQYVEFVQIFIC